MVLAALIYIVLQGSNLSNYFVPVNQYRHNYSKYANEVVRVQGTLLSSSVKFNATHSSLRFTLESKGVSMPILYRGPMPNEQFKNASAIVEGRLVHGIFDAKKLMVQCPDHYVAAKTSAND